jgi:cell division protein FtsN
MAHKDYVARPRSSKKAPPPKPALPYVRIVITLALIGGFAYFLWSIKDKSATETVKIAPPKQVEQDALPELPKEEWDFIKSLPEYTVAVDMDEREDSGKRYLMQCASFRSKDQAEELKAMIALQGFESQVRPSDGGNGRWYRVISGPFDSKRMAEKQKHALDRAKIKTCKIWSWNL